jgi:hypothetical protein
MKALITTGIIIGAMDLPRAVVATPPAATRRCS